jgi:hypothetical protein
VTPCDAPSAPERQGSDMTPDDVFADQVHRGTAATQAGLHPDLASRLHGTTLAELLDDARGLAAAITATGSEPEPPRRVGADVVAGANRGDIRPERDPADVFAAAIWHGLGHLDDITASQWDIDEPLPHNARSETWDRLHRRTLR